MAKLQIHKWIFFQVHLDKWKLALAAPNAMLSASFLVAQELHERPRILSCKPHVA